MYFFLIYSFGCLIKWTIEKLNSDDGMKAAARLHVAKTQADSVICFDAVHKKIDAAVANDTDFCVVGGQDMLLVKDFSFGRGKKGPSLENIMLASGMLSVLKDAMLDCLKMDETSIKVAKFPLFESADVMVRAMIAVGLGCDTLPNGVPGRIGSNVSVAD